jgi:hypothetical protein
MSLFQNPVVFPQALGKSDHRPAFSLKSKVAVPKTEVLEQPPIVEFTKAGNGRKRHEINLY